jgi:hypothetical protein
MVDSKKQFDELTPEECQDLKIEFAPGCFDSFEGTQEELDELIANITEMFKSGAAQEQSRPLNIDELDPEELGKLLPFLVEFDDDELPEEISANKRTLN